MAALIDSNTTVVAALWEWRSESGWISYDQDRCVLLESCFNNKNQVKIIFKIATWTYEVDTQNMIQTNITTKRNRTVRRLCNKEPVWLYQGDFNLLRRFEPHQELRLEDLYTKLHQQHESIDSSCSLDDNKYTLNVNLMEITDTHTDTKMPMYRWLIEPIINQQGDGQPVKMRKVERMTEEITVYCLGVNDTVSKQRAATCYVAVDECIKTTEECCCPICLDVLGSGTVRLIKCSHLFHQDCINEWLIKGCKTGFECPQCKALLLPGYGDCPKGSMKWQIWENRQEYDLPGYSGCPTVVIKYHIPSGTQNGRHPYPGQPFTGTTRVAYLPYTVTGKTVLKLLAESFRMGHTFTVGISVTTGATNTVVWNGVHHKTRIHGGAAYYGYPDKEYLDRVLEELNAKGLRVPEE